MSSSLKKRIHHTKEQWLVMFKSFASSNQSVKDFCKSHHISDVSFYKWRIRLQLDKNPVQKLAFVPLQVTTNPGESPIRLYFPNGCYLQWLPGSEDQLKTLVQLMGVLP